MERSAKVFLIVGQSEASAQAQSGVDVCFSPLNMGDFKLCLNKYVNMVKDKEKAHSGHNETAKDEPTSRKTRWFFVFLGLLTGLSFNSGVFGRTTGSGINIFNTIFFVLVLCFEFWILSRVKLFGLSFFTMARLTMLGIAMISFLYGFVDFFSFFHSGVDVGSFLSSIALGGFFTVFERFLDLREKKEL